MMAASTAVTTPDTLFAKQMTEAGKSLYEQRRPWSEFYRASNGAAAFAKPESFADAVDRIRHHAAYFRINYALILLLLVLCSLIGQPVSFLVVLAVAAAWSLLYLFRSEPLVVLNRSLSEGTVLACLTLGSLVALYLAGVTGTILTAVAVGVMLIAVHGVFRVSDDLFVDEEEAAHRGLVGHGYSAIPSTSRHV